MTIPASRDVTLFDTDCMVSGVDALAPLKYSSTTRRPLRRTRSEVIVLYAPPRMRPTRFARRMLSRPSASGDAAGHSAVGCTAVSPPTTDGSVGPPGGPPHAIDAQAATAATKPTTG